MKPLFYIGFMALLTFDTLGQIAFKLAGERTLPVTFDHPWLDRVLAEPWTWVIVACYLLAFFAYISLIKKTDVGPMFAASHLQIVTVTLFSFVYFGERFTLVQLAGCACIMAGVGLLAATEKEDGDNSAEATAASVIEPQTHLKS